MEGIFDGLNEEQAAAVRATRGAVCILAGAGSGKTTTITRRIAYQVANGTFLPGEILAVTFTEKAAREMRERLARLGADGVRARTFHAEALGQYRHFSGDTSEIVPSKGQLLLKIVKALPMPHRFTAVRDIATEIEWARNRRIGPERYRSAIGDHEPPIPADLMAAVYQRYERTKQRAGLMDFEDLIERTVDMLERDARTRSIVRGRYRAFTVDEYQDVNLLQQTLLDLWVGDRDDVCVVGDDYQSIYGFTGATASYLLGFPKRYAPDCHVVRLTANYRSTPQVLEAANRLVPRLGGSAKTLRPTLSDGPEPVFAAHKTGAAETAWIVERMRALYEAGVPWEQIAVLYRINGRSEDLEEALSEAHVPYQVRGGAFLRRPAARSVLARIRRAESPDVAAVVEAAVRAVGYRGQAAAGDADGDDRGEEATRQSDLGRLLKIAREFPGEGGVEGFIGDLRRRFAPEEDGRGVQLLTYHRAKGLEFEAVFLPRLEEKELPFALSTSDDDIAEERRLLYVGLTRAKRHLSVSWASHREGDRRKFPKPSPFLAEIMPPKLAAATRTAAAQSRTAAKRSATKERPAAREALDEMDAALFDALREWRLSQAKENGVPPYVVFSDDVLARLASARPRSQEALLAISGIGPAKLERYGADVLTLVGEHC